MNDTVKITAAATGGYVLGLVTRNRKVVLLALRLAKVGRRATKAALEGGAALMPKNLGERATAVTSKLTSAKAVGDLAKSGKDGKAAATKAAGGTAGRATAKAKTSAASKPAPRKSVTSQAKSRTTGSGTRSGTRKTGDAAGSTSSKSSTAGGSGTKSNRTGTTKNSSRSKD